MLFYVHFLQCFQPYIVMANVLLTVYFPIQLGPYYSLLLSFMSSLFWFMYAFGYMLQFQVDRCVFFDDFLHKCKVNLMILAVKQA